MCLGVPGKVVSVEGQVALVDFFGVRRETRLDVIDEPVGPGDYVLNHVGFAIRKIPAAASIVLMPRGLVGRLGDLAHWLRHRNDATPHPKLQESPVAAGE